ncbi:MAG: hypothetical protein EOO61_20830 [Hymenobacter sp.]|nr:MAG: hypothetical protein EOO61_20830 [Hymenobacter sp.]
MKTLPPLLLAALLATACQKEAIPVSPTVATANPLTKAFFASALPSTNIKNFASVDLAQLAPSKEQIKVSISLQSAEGQSLEHSTSVQPNTMYQVAVHGKSAAQFILKMGESFEIIQSPPASPSEDAVYLIKTTKDSAPQIYLSVVPLHVENNILTKGKPVNFLLPN